MAVRSTSSSHYAPNSNNQKLVPLDLSDDGPSRIMTEAKRSSFLGQLNSSHKEKGLARVAEGSSPMVQRNNSQKEKGLARGEVKRNTIAAERSSFTGQRNNSQKEKCLARVAERSSLTGQLNNSQKKKGWAIMSGARDFEEITGGEVATTKNLEAEISDMAGIINLQIKSVSETQVVEMDGVGATSIECGCCYWEYRVENMVQCRNGHRFCFKCISKRIHEIIYGGLKAHASLSCMAIDCCEESIPLSEIRRALSNDVVIERYEYRQSQEAIVEAKIEGLVYCPFCNIPYEVDKCVQVLDCSNPKCLKASCIQCKKLSHLPLRCEEAAKKSETALRREIEERMTKAVIRECNICQAELIKAHGCNKLRCVCGNTMCYVCRRTISYLGSDHFCGCFLYSGEPGKPCQICNKCSLIENEIEDNEAFAAREEALRELVDQRPELLHQEIGPPLKTQRRHPSTEEQGYHVDQGNRVHQGHHVQRFRRHPSTEEQGHHVQRYTTPPEFNELRDQHARLPPRQFLIRGGQAVHASLPPPPPEFFRFGNQPTNMDLPPPHLFRFRDGGQPANMVVQPPLPPPEFFRFGVPPQQFFRFDSGGQLANMAVPQQLPPPHFLRFGNGDQLANVLVPPPLLLQHSFRFGNGGQRVNMVVPLLPLAHHLRFSDDNQFANMDLQAQQDYGGHLQPRRLGR